MTTKKTEWIRAAIGLWFVMASMWFMGFLAGRASKENEINDKEEG